MVLRISYFWLERYFMASKVIKWPILNAAPIIAVASHIGVKINSRLGVDFTGRLLYPGNKRVLLILFPVL